MKKLTFALLSVAILSMLIVACNKTGSDQIEQENNLTLVAPSGFELAASDAELKNMVLKEIEGQYGKVDFEIEEVQFQEISGKDFATVYYITSDGFRSAILFHKELVNDTGGVNPRALAIAIRGVSCSGTCDNGAGCIPTAVPNGSGGYFYQCVCTDGTHTNCTIHTDDGGG